MLRYGRSYTDYFLMNPEHVRYYFKQESGTSIHRHTEQLKLHTKKQFVPVPIQNEICIEFNIDYAYITQLDLRDCMLKMFNLFLN